TRSSKTSAPFDLADWTKCSGRSLRSGMTRSGTVYPLPPLAPLTAGTESGSQHGSKDGWPTPSASVAQLGEKPGTWLERRERLKVTANNGNGAGMPLTIAVQMWPTPAARDWKDGGHPSEYARKSPALAAQAGGSLNPTWVEWLMGFPLGWTALEHSEMPSSRKSRKSSVAPSSPVTLPETSKKETTNDRH